MTAPADPSDAVLLAAGSADDFGTFYDRHARAVLAFVCRRTADPDLAADITAETFAAAYLARRRYREEGAGARGWLLGIARHQLARAVRRSKAGERARRRLGVNRVAMDEVSFERIEELADLADLRAEVRDALRSMSPKVAEAVALRVGEDLPYDEVARRLNCSEGAARVRVARGLDQLAELLEVAR
ncbi:MAG: RNA polymerase sigma factor [Actinomycetota bacterium]